MIIMIVTGLTYILDDVIQVKDVIGEALVLPSCARISIRECLAVIFHSGVLDYVIQLPQLPPHDLP